MDVLSYAYRDTTTAALARNRTNLPHNKNQSKVVEMGNNKITALSVEVEGLPYPFGELGVYLTDQELRETAYEILIGACRSSGSSRPLTYVSNSGKNIDRSQSISSSSSSSTSLQKSVTSAAASKVKKALGLKSRKKALDTETAADQKENSVGQKKKSSTVGELMRVQMKISEQIDSRVRRAMLRVAAGQLGRRIESMVLPLELLLQLKSSDFPNQLEYEAWKKRNLKMLEAGLLVHPHIPLDKGNMAAQQLRQILHGAYEKPMETGKHTESVKVLRNLVTLLVSRSFDGLPSEICHWADGVPLNLHLYQILLEACFDVNEDTLVIEEVDEILELIKKTWTVLGINQIFHDLCFAWVLFYRYVRTGQVENDLLLAAVNLLVEIEKDTKAMEGSDYWRILNSSLRLIMDWAEKKLLSYHDSFYRGNIDVMQSVLSLAVSSAKILEKYQAFEHGGKRKEANVECRRIDSYIRSSLHNAFTQEKEKIISSRKSSKNHQNSLPMLSMLAQNTVDMAFNEKEIYSPILKQWHPFATGVAAATLHGCYREELKHFISNISELTPDAVQVLITSDKLEKDLVQMAVADSADSDDGGKAIIQEMTPYEAEAEITKLVKLWIKIRVDRLMEWVERNLQQEAWSPNANKERFAPSAVEVLRTMDETLEAFFLLPIPMHQDLIPELMSGLDRCLQNYIVKAKSGCGSKDWFIPTLPALTRCAGGSKFGVFKKKDRSHMLQPRKSQVAGASDTGNPIAIPQLCIRINTMHLIRKELEVLEKRIATNLSNAGYVRDSSILNKGSGKLLELSASACMEGIHQLSEATAYKIIFHDLSHVLWEYLYIGQVSTSRIEPFLQELEQNLEIVSATVHDKVRTRVITDLMKASFHGFLLVLLAGGPSRAFTLQDTPIVNEDFKFLKDLFWSDGDGLPIDLIDKFSTTVKSVLQLFHTDTEDLIEKFKHVSYGASEKSFKVALPPTSSGQWSASEPDTILRVLCHRNDDIASKFLKKTYNLPKKLGQHRTASSQ